MSISEKVLFLQNRGELEYKDVKPLFIGFQDCKSGHSFGPNIRTCYIVHFIKDGVGVFKKNGKTWQIKKGGYFIIRPNEVIEYVADSENPWSYAWIGFKGDFASVLDNVSPVGEVSANYSTEIRSLLKTEKEVSSESVISLAFKFFSEILSDKCAYVDYVSAVKNYVENNYMNDVTAESIANAINLDRRYLSRIFKEKTGVGIKQYLIDYRLSKSIEYMKQGYNVTQSASMCGYFDLFNYSKIFKKNFGVSPKTFYQNLKKV